MNTTSSSEIGGLPSSTSAHGVEKQVLRLPDVSAVQVNSVAGAASVTFDPALISVEAIRCKIDDCGYPCTDESRSRHVCEVHGCVSPASSRCFNATPRAERTVKSKCGPSPISRSESARGKTLRIIVGHAATIHWSFDSWTTVNDLETRAAGFGCWFADLPSGKLPAGANILFTFRWHERWEEKDFQVAIAESLAGQPTPAAEIERTAHAN